MEEKLLNVEQISDILGIKPKTLYQWKWLKIHLPFVNVGKSLRVSERDLKKFIEDNKVEPGEIYEKNKRSKY